MELLRLLDGALTREPTTLRPELSCDVLCVGAGSAGIYAADAAAQNGAGVILVEQDVTVGGMHLLGNVRGCYYGFRGGAFEADQPQKEDPVFLIPTDRKKLTLLQRLRRSGVKLLCGCSPTGILADGSKVVGLLLFDGQRELAIGANMVIDATSDGFVLRMLPVEKFYGRPRDGKMAPYSVIATLYDGERCRRINRDAGYADPYDWEDFSRKALLAHSQAADILKKGAFLNLATHTGIREGLRFAGREQLRYEDVLFGKVPQKVLFWAYSDLDLHGHLRALDDDLFQTWWVLCNMATVAVRIPVPLGAVVPEGWKGLVTAGRCLSTDSYAQSAVRMNRDCFRMGQCVGTAAAMAVDGDLMAIDYEKYLQKVTAQSCFAGDESRTMGFDSPRRDIPYRPVTVDWERNIHLLETDTPGAFFWSAYCCRDKNSLEERLLGMKAEDTRTRYNIGLALALLESKHALPLLREMVEKRDAFRFADCRRSNQLRTVMAICHLGRLGEPEDVQLLKALVFEDPVFSDHLYTQEPAICFDMVTHAAAALVRLYKRHGLPTLELNRGFHQLLESGTLVGRTAPGCSPEMTAYAETVDFLNEMICETKVEE